MTENTERGVLPLPGTPESVQAVQQTSTEVEPQSRPAKLRSVRRRSTGEAGEALAAALNENGCSVSREEAAALSNQLLGFIAAGMLREPVAASAVQQNSDAPDSIPNDQCGEDAA